VVGQITSRLYVVDQAGQTKAVTAFGNTRALEWPQTNGTFLFQGRQVLDDAHALPRNHIVAAPEGILLLLRLLLQLATRMIATAVIGLARDDKGVVRRAVQGEPSGLAFGLDVGRGRLFLSRSMSVLLPSGSNVLLLLLLLLLLRFGSLRQPEVQKIRGVGT
jgi:hypothetical protein